jgi:hypothetical protein
VAAAAAAVSVWVTTVTVTVRAKPAPAAAAAGLSVADEAEAALVVEVGVPVYGPGRSKMMEAGSQRVSLGPLARLFGGVFVGGSVAVGGGGVVVGTGAVVMGRGGGWLGWLAEGTAVAVSFPGTMGTDMVRVSKVVRPARREEGVVVCIFFCFIMAFVGCVVCRVLGCNWMGTQGTGGPKSTRGAASYTSQVSNCLGHHHLLNGLAAGLTSIYIEVCMRDLAQDAAWALK